jgi:hypothetical protein
LPQDRLRRVLVRGRSRRHNSDLRRVDRFVARRLLRTGALVRFIHHRVCADCGTWGDGRR